MLCTHKSRKQRHHNLRETLRGSQFAGPLATLHIPAGCHLSLLEAGVPLQRPKSFGTPRSMDQTRPPSPKPRSYLLARLYADKRGGRNSPPQPSPVSVPAHVADEALGEVGTDAIQLLRGRQGVKSQLLHVGLHQPILKESEAGRQGSRSQKASGAQTVSAASRL